MSKSKILIVDDDSNILEMLNDFFNEDGYMVTLASSGNEAISILKDHVFDVILSDYKMADGNGVDLLYYVITIDETIRPKFFFMTGFADISEDEAKKIGALKIFRKPFHLQNVVQEISGHIA